MATTAGDRWLLVGGLVGAVALAQALGCAPEAGGGGDEPPPDDDTVGALLAQVGPGVVLPALTTARDDARALADAVADWADAPDDPDARATAQDAFEAAFRSWHAVEAMQLGPLGPSLSTLGGEDVADTVYSWPVVSPCRVDQETVGRGWEDAGWADGALVNVQGLDAIEHLLFVQTADNACPPQVQINSEGTWDDLSEAQVWAARSEQASVLADRVVALVDGQITAWSGGALADQLAAGEGPWSSQDEALNSVYDASFFLYKQVVDRKIGQPAGVNDCSDEVCAEDAEALPSGLSVVALEGNVAGFRALFTGGDGTGLDDLLAARGHADVRDAVLAAADEVEAELAALSGPIDTLLAADAAALDALHADAKALADLVRADVATVLSLQVPQEAAGDND